ncbi:MAG: terminase large subunit domain-containing protein [Nocardioidaceae bacterium]
MPAADVRRGDGRLYGDFIEAVCRVTKDSVAAPVGELIRLRSWQRSLLGALLARRVDGRLRHRQALVGVARKNGKSGVGAGVGLASLVMGPDGGEVYSCAADKAQAKVVFDTARRMVAMDPELSALLNVYRDVIEFEKTGSVYRALSAEAFTKEGLNPHLVVFDEVHAQPTRELWDVMALAMGARVEPLLLGITTAGVRTDSTGQDSLCFSMYEYGKRIVAGEVDDPSFFMAWWEPSAPRADHRDPAVWAEANPGLGDLVAVEDFVSTVGKTPEAEFRTKRTNVFVASSETWLPAGAWDGCVDTGRLVEAGARVVLAFDGSKTGDSTALVGVTVEDRPHVFVVGSWERPADGLAWRVPRAEVRAAVRAAGRRWDVVEVAWDDWMWQDAREELEDDGLPIEVYPQTQERMGPATQRFYEAVVDHGLTHSGHPGLARHLANAVSKPTPSGKARIVKDNPRSKRWIDLAVCAVMGVDRAAWWASSAAPSSGFNIW